MMRPPGALRCAPVFCDDDEEFEQLARVGDADELCRRLLQSPAGWGRSTRHVEAIGLLAKVAAPGGWHCRW